MVNRIHSRRYSPEFNLSKISDDVIQKLGEDKPLKYLKRKPARKLLVKRPAFETYMRMKTDKSFRKEYLASNRIHLSDKLKLMKKEAPKCSSVLGQHLRHKLPPLFVPTLP